MRTFKALGALLTYPEAELAAAAGELVAAVEAEGLLAPDRLAALGELAAWMQANEPLDLQEAYVQLFDRSRSLSLHLYEHVHGDSRDRGQAMVNLQTLYQLHGLEPDPRELPDYLPLLCEFLSLVPLEAARSVLGDGLHIIELLRQRLAERGSPYAAVFAALVALAGQAVDRQALAELLAGTPVDLDSLAALDEAWEDKPVSFGAGDALEACPAARPVPPGDTAGRRAAAS